jgi:general secretion pathway protein G
MIVRGNFRAARKVVRAGFSLMELMVVVAILLVLAGTGSVIYVNVKEGMDEDIARQHVLTTLSQAADAYNMNNGTYPQNLVVLTQVQPSGKPALLETDALLDPWGREYLYAYPGSHHPGTSKPDIWSQGKNGDKMLGNWSNTGLGR